MDSLQQMNGNRHEYRLKAWQRWFYLLLGVAAIAGGFFLAVKIISEPGGVVPAAIMMFFPILGIYLLAWALRSRLVIDGTRIEVRGALKESTANLSQIDGFRNISTRNGSYTLLYLKEGRGKITISQSFDTGDDYRAWFQQLTNLDARDRDAILSEISQDTELGSTPEERLSALKTAKTRSIIIIVIACAAAIGLNFDPLNFSPISAMLLALTPVVVGFLIRQQPHLYAIPMKKSDPRADFSIALIATSFGLAMHFRQSEFVSMKPLLLVMILVALAYIALFYGVVSKNANQAGALAVLLFYAASYSFGLATVADTVADRTRASIYFVPVTGKHVSSGKSTTYYLRLAPWGPLDKPNDISVSRGSYYYMQSGDQVCLGLHPGWLHAAWYRLANCPVQSAPEQAP
jgi:FtsH-binding integral membrane protein